MNILASRLPALKFLGIAGLIQLGLTLSSNVNIAYSGIRNAHVEHQLVYRK